MRHISFLDLPYELREEIYGYMLRPAPYMSKALFKDAHHGWSLCLPIEVLLTCKQIAYESRRTLDRYQNFSIAAEVLPDNKVAGFETPEESSGEDYCPTSYSPNGGYAYRPQYPRNFTLLVSCVCIGEPPAPLFARYSITANRLTKFIPLLATGPRIKAFTIRIRSFQQRNIISFSSSTQRQRRLSELLAPLEGHVDHVTVDWDYPSSGGKEEMAEICAKLTARKRPSLLALPAELREMIYHHLITIEKGVPTLPRCTEHRQVELLEKTRDYQLITQRSANFATAILRTCRQLHDEASSYFYRNLTWAIDIDDFKPSPLPSQVCPAYQPLVRHFKFTVRLAVENLRGFNFSLKIAEVLRICTVMKAQAIPIRTLEIGTDLECCNCYERRVHRNPIFFEIEREEMWWSNIASGFGQLKGLVDTVRMGRMMSLGTAKESAEWKGEFYRALKESMGDEVEWHYPYPDKDIKD